MTNRTNHRNAPGMIAANPRTPLLSLALVTAGALVVGTAAPGHDAGAPVAPPDEVKLALDDLLEASAASSMAAGAGETTLAEVAVYFEENSTDEDLGIQFFLDGEPWQRVMILNESGKRLVDLKVKGSAQVIGLTEIFSESAEPSFDDLPRDEFLALFPPGQYTMLAKTVEGEWHSGTPTLTHDMPAPTDILAPAREAEVDASQPLVIEWSTVPDPDFPGSVIESYHVVVEKDEEDEPLRVFTIDMLPGDTTYTVSPGFLEPGKDYKVEILVLETSGNRTITEIPFSTMD